MGMSEGSRWNIKRGLNRLFLAFALCWYIGSLAVLWNPWSAAVKAERAVVTYVAPKNPDIFDQVYYEDLTTKARESRPVGITVTLLLVPPAVYGFAVVLWWIARGFRGPAHAEQLHNFEGKVE
jgi:hypothetical protein